MDRANQKNNKKLSKVLSTKLSADDYNEFLLLTKLEYQAGLIKEESTSELLRFTIRHILNQLHNNLIYPILEGEQEQQKKVLNNQQQQQQQQQQLHSQVILPSSPSTTTAAASHQTQVPNISRTNNLVGEKMTLWKSSSLLSTQMNHHNTLW
jgi:hypothetical protein